MKKKSLFIIGLCVGLLSACAKDYTTSTDTSRLMGMWKFEGKKDIYIELMKDGSYFQHQVYNVDDATYVHQTMGQYKVSDDNLVSYAPVFDSCLGPKVSPFEFRVKSIETKKMTSEFPSGAVANYVKVEAEEFKQIRDELSGKVSDIKIEMKCFSTAFYDDSVPLLSKAFGDKAQVEVEDQKASEKIDIPQASSEEIAEELTGKSKEL